MATQRETHDETVDRPQVLTAITIGLILTLIGIAGPILGGGREGELLIFGRNYLHDAIHVLTGLPGAIAGYYMGGKLAESYNKYGGLLYVLVFVLGLVFFSLFATLINQNVADLFLHLALALILVGVGFGMGRGRR